jgi:hypothetical protein
MSERRLLASGRTRVGDRERARLHPTTFYPMPPDSERERRAYAGEGGCDVGAWPRATRERGREGVPCGV